MASNGEYLRLTDVHAHYGESHILHGVDLVVRKGEVVTLLGRNGAGRTTTLKSILGLVGRRTGSIVVDGHETVNMAPHEVARLGLGYCPEERGIFASLSCEENLKLPPELVPGGMSIDEIYEIFPNLYERRDSPGTRLSGGQHLLLDEISEGLAPVIVQTLARTVRMLRDQGFTIVMVEQNFRFAAPLADQFYIMEHGQIVEAFGSNELSSKSAMLHEFLGI